MFSASSILPVEGEWRNGSGVQAIYVCSTLIQCLLNSLSKFSSRLEPLLWMKRKSFLEYRIDTCREGWIECCETGDRLLRVLLHDLKECFSSEWELTTDEFKEQDAERININADIKWCISPNCCRYDLRSHTGRRASKYFGIIHEAAIGATILLKILLGQDVHKAKACNLYRILTALHNIGGTESAMQNAIAMCIVESTSDLAQHT